MNANNFLSLTNSLRQYRRADLSDFKDILSENPINSVYVDPLPGEAVLRTVTSLNTTFVLGKKGTGKSTVFAKAQEYFRTKKDIISIYIDVKSLYEIVSADGAVATATDVDSRLLQTHLLRKAFLGSVLSELLKEIDDFSERLSIWDRWIGTSGRRCEEVRSALTSINGKVAKPVLTEHELPILQLITNKTKDRERQKKGHEEGAKLSGKICADSTSIDVSMSEKDISEYLEDAELYREYSDAVLRSYPFAQLISEIKDLLNGAGLSKIVIFFDDFSEINLADQKLFVDVILAPLNNSSDERIKIKVAGYPGRVYYGKIDPGKIETVQLDFYDLYKSAEIQTAEASAVDYTRRLLTKRFDSFHEDISIYFDSANILDDYYRLVFEVSLNVPRVVGNILHLCYLDRISRGQKITAASIRLAAQKYFEGVTNRYFNLMDRYAVEPFDQKLDRHNQGQLLKQIVAESKDVRRRIAANEIGGTYFNDVPNPPASHFAVAASMEPTLMALELNFLISKYHVMRDKDGQEVSIYALAYGLCESEKIPWGYPRGRRDDRSYFVQRCFNYNRTLHDFLAKSQTIRCDSCGHCGPVADKAQYERYKWRCPECANGRCLIVNLGEDFKAEVLNLDTKIMLQPIELRILEALQTEARPMRANEISVLVDTTYHMVGKRTGKLQEMGLVDKKKDNEDNVRSTITEKASRTYFESSENDVIV